VCSGTLPVAGTLVGTISGNVTINGACAVDAGPAVVTGNLEVSRGSTLVAAFAGHDSSLTVGGNLTAKDGAAAIMGCNPVHSPCIDDNSEHPTLTSSDSIKGNFTASGALGVVLPWGRPACTSVAARPVCARKPRAFLRRIETNHQRREVRREELAVKPCCDPIALPAWDRNGDRGSRRLGRRHEICCRIHGAESRLGRIRSGRAH
jgi:hypothetical protein